MNLLLKSYIRFLLKFPLQHNPKITFNLLKKPSGFYNFVSILTLVNSVEISNNKQLVIRYTIKFKKVI